jgi:hypothetical protein
MPVVRFGGEGKRRGEWGVKRRGRQGGARARWQWRRQLRRQLPEEEEAGWGPRGSERRGWRRARPAKSQVPMGRGAGGWAWEKEAAQERRRGSGPVVDHTGRAKRKEAGPKSLLGLKSKEVKEKSIFN